MAPDLIPNCRSPWFTSLSLQNRVSARLEPKILALAAECQTQFPSRFASEAPGLKITPQSLYTQNNTELLTI